MVYSHFGKIPSTSVIAPTPYPKTQDILRGVTRLMRLLLSKAILVLTPQSRTEIPVVRAATSVSDSCPVQEIHWDSLLDDYSSVTTNAESKNPF